MKTMEMNNMAIMQDATQKTHSSNYLTRMFMMNLDPSMEASIRNESTTL